MLNEKKYSQPTSRIYNAKGVAAAQILGINRMVGLKIIIEGKTVSHYDRFSLNQSASRHHRFELRLPYDALGDAESHELEQAQQFLGKRLTAVFSYRGLEDSAERTFVGVVLEVSYEQEQGSLGAIVLKGSSPTILLDAAPHTQSFGGTQDISLNSIAESVIKEGLSSHKFDYRVDSSYIANVSYSCQYNETHYNYLARMAEAYGEQFFYDGEVLHFGAIPPPGKALELVYGSNVSDVKVSMRAMHVTPAFYGYNSSRNERLSSGEPAIRHISDIARRAYDISKKTFNTPSLRVAPIKSSTFKDVDASQKGAAGSSASEVFVTSGRTSIPFLYPGCIADIRMRKKDSSRTSYFTRLMVVEASHEVDARGSYSGTFSAIAADSGFLPRPDFAEPLAEAQVATVVSNADPQNQGRVQVRFDWQLHDTTEFIRVMSPDAGGSDKVSKNRGFMSVPEVGDQVMVHFQHNHPDRPFVMGGMFHGKVGGGGGAGNNVMSLSSKSGNIIQFHDGCGIEIKDRSGNHVTLSGTGDIKTEVSNNSEEFIGNNLTINVASNTTIDVGKGKSKVTMDNAGKVNITSAKEIKFETGSSSITLHEDGCIIIEGKNITVKGTQSVCNTSDKEVHIKASGKAEAKFNGITIINGDQVDINKYLKWD